MNVKVKMYLIKSKNGIMINIYGNVKKSLIGVFVKMIIFGIIVHVVVSVVNYAQMLNI